MAKKKETEEIEEIDDEILEDGEKPGKVKKQHITIEEYDFKMISSRPADDRFFDFYYLKTVNKGKENERQEFKLEGYGLSIKNCLIRIASLRAGKAGQKEFKSFKEYAQLYLKTYKEMEKLVNIIPEID